MSKTMSRLQPHDSATELEELARLALEGSRPSLEQLVVALQGDIFGLALRMLGDREDAEDATQEILIRIVTRLSQFDFRSRLKTWAYRVAVNCILDFRKTPEERRRPGFGQLAGAVVAGISQDSPAETERSILIEEVKIGCTLGMLQCLDRPHRAAYILGEIMEAPGPEAAEVLGISAALFRKRLQKARAAMVSFLRSYCGLVSDQAPCRCNRQVPAALRAGKIPPEGSGFAAAESSFEEARAKVRRVEEARWTLEVHRTSQPLASPSDLARRLIAALDVHLEQAGRP
jgi:RNA polymerase sigma factor (sigma-70 family)